MSEWNRYGRRDRPGYEAERRGGWDERDHHRDRHRDRHDEGGGREQRSFQRGGGGPGPGGGYGPGGRSFGPPSYIEPGGSYGGEVFGGGGRGYGYGYGGGSRSGSYGDESRFDYGGRGEGRRGYGSSAYGRDYGRGYGEDRAFGDPNDQVRRVADGDNGPSLFGRGEHRGRGPKNYVRSDERIRDDINDRLSDDDWLDASEIEVAVDKGEVTLTGTVARREDKRRAEDLVEQVSGVKHVQNSLRIQHHGLTGDPSNYGSAMAGSTGSTGVGDRSSLASGTTSTGGTIDRTN